jgi:NADH-ubiquinone oxidoreductase chain 3
MSLLLALIGLLFLIQISLSDNPITNGRQLGCIESGFEKTNYSTYISRAFFIIAVLYVLFDIELILLLPRLFVLSGQAQVYFSLLILLRIIIITLLLE